MGCPTSAIFDECTAILTSSESATSDQDLNLGPDDIIAIFSRLQVMRAKHRNTIDKEDSADIRGCILSEQKLSMSRRAAGGIIQLCNWESIGARQFQNSTGCQYIRYISEASYFIFCRFKSLQCSFIKVA